MRIYKCRKYIHQILKLKIAFNMALNLRRLYLNVSSCKILIVILNILCDEGYINHYFINGKKIYVELSPDVEGVPLIKQIITNPYGLRVDRILSNKEVSKYCSYPLAIFYTDNGLITNQVIIKNNLKIKGVFLLAIRC
jgi:ribosomal protein S8